MNLMREQHFRRNCAQHTISVASALFGECRTEENAEFAERCDRIVSRPESSVAVSAATPPSEVPVLGATIMRLRNRYVSGRIFEGGLASPEALPKELAEELYKVGLRPGHYRGFLSLLAHERLWPKARNEYASIKVPVLPVYGEHDWAPLVERERTRLLIPSVATEMVRNGSHFLSLDRPRELQHLIVGFARD